MQGYSHGLTGAAAWLAITTNVTVDVPLNAINVDWQDTTLQFTHNLINASPEVAFVGAVLAAGFCFWPDWDHHNGTIAHSLPPFTGWVAGGVEQVSGGHRHGTHSLVGVAVLTLLTWLAAFWTMDVDGRTVALGAGLIAVPTVAFAIKGSGIRLGRKGTLMDRSLGPWVASLATAGAATHFLDYSWDWLPLAAAVGSFVHVLGDSLTTQGVPWLWPWNPKPPKWLRGIPFLTADLPILGRVFPAVWQNNGYFRFAILGDTTSIRESIFASLVAVYIVITVAYASSLVPGL